MARTTRCTVEGCAMCAGASCALCGEDDLAAPCGHDVAQRHLASALSADDQAPFDEPSEARVPTTPLPEKLLADRIEVDPADPDSVAHFLETWAHIVRTKRRFVLILQ